MALLGNIIWFVIGGWWSFLLYALLGGLFCITIIGIPIGKSLFQYAKLMAFPYGKVIVKETFIKGEDNVSAIRKVGGLIANILWLPFGVVTFLFNIATMIVMACTIIGIPVAIVIAKSSTFLLWPVGAKVITKDQADAIRMERTMMKVAGTAMAANAYMNQQPTQPVYQQPVQTVYQQPVQPMNQQPVQTVYQQPVQVMYQQPAQPNMQDPNSVQSQQQTSFWQSQAVENFKVEGAKALENIKDTSGKAAVAIAETGGKAAVAIAETTGKAATALWETSSAGVANLKNLQQTKTEQMLEQKKDIKIEELLLQIEAKLYTNNVMAWVVSFIEYITAAIGIISIIIGIVLISGFDLFGIVGIIFGGIMYGIRASAAIMSLSALLGMIKRNHIFVIIVLALQIVSNVVLGCMGMGISIITLLCCLGILIGYVMIFMINGTNMMSNAANNIQATYSNNSMPANVQTPPVNIEPMNAQTPPVNIEPMNTQTTPVGDQSTQMCICSVCGKEYNEPTEVCVRCGNKL